MHEVRCPECHRKLFMASGTGTTIHIMCTRKQCGKLIEYTAAGETRKLADKRKV